MIGKSLIGIACATAIIWSSAALAVYQETSVTVTDQGKPVPGQTVTLTEKVKNPERPRQKPKIKRIVKRKTNKDGKILVGYDDRDDRAAIFYDVTLTIAGGQSRTIRDVPAAALTGLVLDFSNALPTGESQYSSFEQIGQPLGYLPSGWNMVIGGNVGGGESWNHYGNVPAFDGSGAGGGGFFVARYDTPSGWFFGPEFGGMALNVNGTNADGAFSRVRWMAYEGGQAGFRFNGPQAKPVNLYVGVGASQAGYSVGINADARSESMGKTLNGWSAHTGFEVQPAQVALPNLWVGFDYRYSYWSGTIGDDRVSGGVHFFSATASYQFAVGR